MKKIMAADIRNILAVITSLGCFIIIYLLIIKQIPEPNHDIVIAGVGYILGAANGMVYGYYFGASKAPARQAEPAQDDSKK
jgi:hypothetical protein